MLFAFSSPLLYVACLSLCVIALVLALYVRSVLREKEAQEHTQKLELQDMFLTASLGGYIYWNKDKQRIISSINLIKMLQAQEPIEDLPTLLEYFAEDATQIVRAIEHLTHGETTSFRLNTRPKVRGQTRILYAFGSAVYRREGGVCQGVVIWFFDVTDFVGKLERTQSENTKLKERLEEHIALLNLLPMPVWKSDAQDELLYNNAAYARVFGKQEEGRLALEKPWKPLATKAMRRKTSISEQRHVVSNGERYLFEFTETPIAEEREIVGYARDLSEEERTKKELSRHISAHSELLESSASAMAIYTSDMRLKFYNNAFVKLWGFDERWLSTHPVYGEVLEVLREKRKLPEQADFKEFRKKQLQLFTDLIEPLNEFFHLPDGRTLRVIVLPHALGGVLFAYEDMTDRLAMERSYNTLIAVQKVTLDHLSEGVALFGEDGRLKFYNPIYVDMWSSEEGLLDGKPHVNELLERNRKQIPAEKWEQYREQVIESLSARVPSKIRTTLVDGRIMERSAVPLPDGATLVSYMDVTDSIRMEQTLRERNEALEQADRVKTEFLANISYELRTPLTSIIGFSEALQSNMFGALNEKQRDYAQGIFDSSHQLLALINDILDLASMEAGHMNLDIAATDVHGLLTNVKKLFAERVRDAGLTIEIDCPSTIGTVAIDERRIKQVLFNLLNNSLKFTPEGGVITMGAVGNQRTVKIWVEDNGIGIPEEEQPKVFDRFFKSSNARKLSQLGTGLGLSVVKNIIELHEGKVKLFSKNGKGTRVECYFKRNLPLLSNIVKVRNKHGLS